MKIFKGGKNAKRKCKRCGRKQIVLMMDRHQNYCERCKIEIKKRKESKEKIKEELKITESTFKYLKRTGKITKVEGIYEYKKEEGK